MQRKRSNVYYAGPAVSPYASQHHRQSYSTINNGPENTDPHFGVFGKCSEKDFFADLRVEIDRELASKPALHPGLLRSKTSIIRSSGVTKVTTKTKPAATNPNESSLPSSSLQMPTRCQSASAVRKKLFHAMEQSSSSGYQHPNHKLQAQVDALRNLASTSFSKAATRASKGYRTLNAESASISHGTVTLTRKNSGVLSSTCKMQNQDECIAGVGIGPSRSTSVSILMSDPSHLAINPCPVLVGGYRSSSVQLEVELVERLNEIGRSNLPEKTLSRTRACQNVLDRIVLQDEHYGRLLSRIRDEFSTYVDMTSRKSPTKSNNTQGSKSWCACGQDVFEFALLKQENTVMKKRVSSMQHEIETLQAALRQARTEDSRGRHHDSIDDTSSTGSWPEDDQEDELEDTQLLPTEDMSQQHFRPQGVPMLSFASLPSYSDEEEEEEGY